VARRIAHEIKNPLTPIQLSAERLQRKFRKGVPAEDLEIFDRCTDTIVRQVGDIGRMVDEFSAFARMPAPEVRRAGPGGAAARRRSSPSGWRARTLTDRAGWSLCPATVIDGDGACWPRPDQYPQERGRGGDGPGGRQAQAEGRISPG
jgi:hypothetical protein